MKRDDKIFCDYCGKEITGEHLKKGDEDFCCMYCVAADDEPENF